ncbi:hypothetical protein [Ralstonia pickettii]|uniref:hypothetical protein n=1 Tax=Ralstonia pickettii TaxID=329 RepID=UPI0015FCC187|nr:hypothetical protein [Ralstonia pickettii]MBB0036795.1 hypothetical protein [Ralstonia pickettii]MBB0099174.1 hypothetical protein [Ralstonia pickettii]MBB0109130.1 hypothetical protein [Ralstonia pickettii]MBB0130109.1 hypothetical protein [Ralstonia pickettii]MBB0163898.1 hypothetical protein [Ralstonia pickettii]
MTTESRDWTRHWTALKRELILRAVEPFESPTFVLFFLAIVVGVGGIGIWVELFKLIRPQGTPDPLGGFITSLIAFFFAVVGTSCTQLIIEESESKALRALAQFVLFLAFVGAALAIAGVGSGQAGVWSWTLASIAALVVWWVANAKSPGLRDPDAPTGGAVTKKLPGDLSDYKTK